MPTELSTLRVLVTGSSGLLGSALVRRLREVGAVVVGLDIHPSATTEIVGSVADRPTIREALRAHGITAILHAGALHKPQVATQSRETFVATNVLGTQHLLEEATAGSTVERFVFTSTTSVLVRASLAEGTDPSAPAQWMTECTGPLAPRNIYGVTKLAGEHLCRLHHRLFGLPVIVCRPSRFFTEEDDCAASIVQDGANTKANEYLYRRLSLADCVDVHLQALLRAPELGYDLLIASASTPFQPTDVEALGSRAPEVVARYFPKFPDIYRTLGWTMFDRIDRVYVSRRAQQRLGWRARQDFASVLDALERGEDPQAVVGHRAL